jgi:hypothetical protein
MRQYAFTITRHDAERPWIVLETSHETIVLDDDVQFFEWTAQRWPAPRWSVQLDPWQLTPAWP